MSALNASNVIQNNIAFEILDRF